MFTLVVTTYNRSKLLRRCLDSIKKQSFRDYEVLILDDHSSDDTPQVAKDYTKDERFKYIKFEKKMGFGDKLQFEAKKSGFYNREWLFFVCDDDYIKDENLLEKISSKVLEPANALANYIVVDNVNDHCGFYLHYESNKKELPKSLFTYAELSASQKEALSCKYGYIFKTEFYKSGDYQNYELQQKGDVYLELPFEEIYKTAKILYVDAFFATGNTPNARTKYIDLYNWIVSMGMYFHNTKVIESSTQTLKVYFTEAGTPQNVLVNWGGESLARMLAYFMSREDYSLYLRGFATLIKTRFQEQLNAAYLQFNAMLLNEEEMQKAVLEARKIAVYGDGNISAQIQRQLKERGKEFFVVDDFKSGCLRSDALFKSDVDVVFIATLNVLFIQEIFKKLQPLKQRVRIVTLVARDDTYLRG